MTCGKEARRARPSELEHYARAAHDVHVAVWTVPGFEKTGLPQRLPPDSAASKWRFDFSPLVA
ncbi:MAG TPA: hypothetical protein VEI25_20035, partial [Paraburkholderia sp.]|nr:hypothetical protein [Paraburkholderia sp.]